MKTKVLIIAKKEKSEEATEFFKTYTKLSPKIKKVKKKEDKELLSSLVNTMKELLKNLS